MERINFTANALSDLEYWKKSGNAIILKRIHQLIKAIQDDPYNGIGKPELLKHDFAGHWSRRINQEHRIIYKLQDSGLTIYSLRFHYKK
jgi:toxin YoeB